MFFTRSDKKIVVLIEDNESLSRILAEELVESGYDVQRALNGEKGLKLVRKFRPDVVLLDLNLPKKSGLEVLDDIRTDARISGTPVVIMTVESDYDHFKASLEYKDGVTYYITKTDKTLSDVIRKVDSVCGSPEKKPL